MHGSGRGGGGRDEEKIITAVMAACCRLDPALPEVRYGKNK